MPPQSAPVFTAPKVNPATITFPPRDERTERLRGIVRGHPQLDMIAAQVRMLGEKPTAEDFGNALSKGFNAVKTEYNETTAQRALRRVGKEIVHAFTKDAIVIAIVNETVERTTGVNIS